MCLKGSCPLNVSALIGKGDGKEEHRTPYGSLSVAVNPCVSGVQL